MKYYLEVKLEGKTVMKTDWGDGIWDLKNAENRAYRLISQYKKAGKSVKVEIREMTNLYDIDNGILIETIERNPYEK